MELYFAIGAITLLSLGTAVLHVIENGRFTSSERRAFILTGAVVAVAIVGECAGIALNGTHLLNDYAVKLAKLLDYTFTPAVAVAVVHPVASRARFRKMAVLLGLNAALQLVSVFFGLTFYVDEAGYYQHGLLYPLYILLIAIGLVYLIITLREYSAKFDNENRGSLYAIVGISVIATAAQQLDGDLRVVNVALAYCAILLLLHYTEYTQQSIAHMLSETSRENDRHQRAMSALSSNFLSTHLVNLETGEVMPITTTDRIEQVLAQRETIPDKLAFALRHFCTENYIEQAMIFADFDTLDDRLRDRHQISFEFVGKFSGWCRASFIDLEHARDGKVTQFLFAVQIIDEEKRYTQELLALSNVDALTGLNNQRAYRERLDMLRSLEALPHNLAVLSMDVNALKHVNDTVGHQAGDELLIGAAECIKKAFGTLGFCYRQGGDEFAVIAPVDGLTCRAACKTLDDAVANWTHDDVPFLSLSYGYAVAGENPGTTLDELLALADKNMYASKKRFYEESGLERRGSLGI